MAIGMFGAGIIIGFIKGWLFTICILGLSPVIFISMALFGKAEQKN